MLTICKIYIILILVSHTQEEKKKISRGLVTVTIVVFLWVLDLAEVRWFLKKRFWWGLFVFFFSKGFVFTNGWAASFNVFPVVKGNNFELQIFIFTSIIFDSIW